MLGRVVEMGEREGVLRVDDGCYVVDRAAWDRETPFNRMRLERMTRVIANELEPVRPAVRAVERALGLRDADAAHRVSRRVMDADLRSTRARARRGWATRRARG